MKWSSVEISIPGLGGNRGCGADLIHAADLLDPVESWIEQQGWPIVCDHDYPTGHVTYSFETAEAAALFKLFWK